MGRIFETMCGEYISILNSNKEASLPFKIRQIGRWWGTNPITKSEEEIDIIGINDKLSSAIFCECKFRNEFTDTKILDLLINKAERWKFNHKHYMLFSKSGFTKGLLGTAEKNKNIHLVSLKDMYK